MCLGAYNKNDLAGLIESVKIEYSKDPKKAIIILKYVSKNITISNDHDLGKAKELRKFWKSLDPSSYKKDGKILKDKCKKFLSKNTDQKAQQCKLIFDRNRFEILFRNMESIYEIEPNICRYILKYIARNTRCDGNSQIAKIYEFLVRIR